MTCDCRVHRKWMVKHGLPRWRAALRQCWPCSVRRRDRLRLAGRFALLLLATTAFATALLWLMVAATWLVALASP